MIGVEYVGLRSDQYLKKGENSNSTNKSGMRTREWSDQEILLLLEGSRSIETIGIKFVNMLAPELHA